MKLKKAVAEIDLKALSHNLGVVREKTGGTRVLAVVKADAYGHGAVPVAKHLIQKGVSTLGVAFTSEAIILREAGITCPILVFFDRNNIVDLFNYDLTPVVFDVITAKELSRAPIRTTSDS